MARTGTRKGIHTVRIEDPWFGSYIRIYGLSSYTTVSPDIYIGSLVERVIHVETFDNRGSRAKREGFTEKPFKHTYAEGVLRGVITYDNPSESGRFVVPLENGLYKWYATPFDIPQTRWELQVEVERDPLFVHCKVVCIEYLVTGEVPNDADDIPLQDFAAAFKLRRSEDPITGNVLYDQLYDVYLSSRPGLTIEAAANPLTGAAGNPWRLVPSLWKLLSDEMERVKSYKGRGTSRDKSIYAAIDNVKIADINWLETLPELAHPIEFLRQLSSLFRVRPDLLGIIRAIANFHLFWKYVVKTGILTWSEFRKLVDFLMAGGFRSVPHMTLTGRGAVNDDPVGDDNISVSYNTKVCYGVDTSTVDRLLDTLNMLRLTPRLVDLWDIVPYSFVVDWVIPVSDAIDNMEKMSVQLRMPFRYIVLTQEKRSHLLRDFYFDALRYHMDITVVDYNREVRDVFPSDVWLGVDFQDMTWKKWITAAALFAQKLK